MMTLSRLRALRDPMRRAKEAKAATTDLEAKLTEYREVLDGAVVEALGNGVAQAEVARHLGVTRAAIHKKHGNGAPR